MANPSKKKGTQGENEVVDLLRAHGLDAHRAETNKASWDVRIVGTPWRIESKRCARWLTFQWIRHARHHADGDPWIIYAAHGDRRSVEGKGVGMVAIMDAALATQLLEVYLDTVGP